jgi:hypothetical protein
VVDDVSVELESSSWERLVLLDSDLASVAAVVFALESEELV